MEFADPRGIRNSLHTLYTLLAGGAISPRRAAILAYISKMLLQALVVIDEQENRPVQHEIVVPPRRQSFPPGLEGDAAFAQSQACYDQATTASTDKAVSATEEGPTRDLVTDFANRLPKWKSRGPAPCAVRDSLGGPNAGTNMIPAKILDSPFP